ncbi:MAG: hypothetical protein MUC86_15365 [Burkholderiaceae bacterium]|nr:hypothetical protein [Burkholderiaceae bacterium]
MAVIVDVLCEDELLHLVLANIDTQPALRVRASFNLPLIDGSGRDVTRLALFTRCEFLAPGRSIRTLLDTRGGYFRRRQPARFAVTLSYRDVAGGVHEHLIRHDLSIYKNLALVSPSARAR